MKKIFCILTALTLLLSACSSSKSGSVTLRATVLEINDGYYLVEPVEGSAELKSADQITVPMKNMAPSPEPEVGGHPGDRV